VAVSEYLKSALAMGLVVTMFSVSGLREVAAGPMSVPHSVGMGLSAPIDTVHYRRHYRRYYRYSYDPGGAAFAAAAMGLMTAGIVAAASRPYYYGGWGYPYYGYGWGWGYPGPYYGWGW
jgi:hypothetical protein